MLEAQSPPLAIEAAPAPVRAKPSVYPSPFAERMTGRTKRPLGALFGLKIFGVNLTELAPGAISSLMHRHSKQDEFVYVTHGELWLVTDRGEQRLTAGMCAGFPAGGLAHHLVNRSADTAAYLEIGDRGEGDTADYPADDLAALAVEGEWRFTHKDGAPF